jgi:hypothetical protein
MSSPFHIIFPVFGYKNPAIRERRVLFPAPLAPTRRVFDPWGNAAERLSEKLSREKLRLLSSSPDICPQNPLGKLVDKIAQKKKNEGCPHTFFEIVFSHLHIKKTGKTRYVWGGKKSKGLKIP